MNTTIRTIAAGILTVLAALTAAIPCGAGPSEHSRAENVIFMVPDGMGLAVVTAARIFDSGPDGPGLALERLPVIGTQRTHSADSTVTDSAAAASAWASGEKFANGEVSCHGAPDGTCRDLKPTLLELAKSMGKATGLVVTGQISHATPAAFAAHSISRYCGAEIARQYIAETGVDIILGGGLYQTRGVCDVYPASFAPADKRRFILELAEAAGYATVSTADGLEAAVESGRRQVLGLFEQNGVGKGKTPERFRVDPSAAYPETEPTLPQMTAAALAVLGNHPKGFFLLVEGSQIDWANHAGRAAGFRLGRGDMDVRRYQVAETLAFDRAVGVVLDWVAVDSRRQARTLIVVAPDHETGGFAVNGPRDRRAGRGQMVAAGWTTGGHTAGDVPIWSGGPGSRMLGRALDNTEVYGAVKAAMSGTSR